MSHIELSEAIEQAREFFDLIIPPTSVRAFQYINVPLIDSLSPHRRHRPFMNTWSLVQGFAASSSSFPGVHSR